MGLLLIPLEMCTSLVKAKALASLKYAGIHALDEKGVIKE